MYFNIKGSLRKADVSPRSSLLRDVSRRGTSATQRQKFQADDINLVVMGFQMQISSTLCFSSLILEKCSSENELQQNSNASSREDYISQILTVLLEIHRVYI